MIGAHDEARLAEMMALMTFADLGEVLGCSFEQIEAWSHQASWPFTRVRTIARTRFVEKAEVMAWLESDPTGVRA